MKIPTNNRSSTVMSVSLRNETAQAIVNERKKWKGYPGFISRLLDLGARLAIKSIKENGVSVIYEDKK